MLASPLRLKQRASFATLLDTVACHSSVTNDGDERFGDACTRAAGLFGILEIDAILVVFAHLLPAPFCTLLTATAIVGDRASKAPPARLAVLDALQDVQSLARTCKFVAAALHAHGAAVRIEAAAAWCTPLAPACSSSHDSTTYDALGQVLQEEKSRFEVRVLEGALKNMAAHCAGDHCRAARHLYNHGVTHRAVAPNNRDDVCGVQPLASTAPRLALRRPRMRVVTDAGTGIDDHDGRAARFANITLEAHPDRNECVLVKRADNGNAIRLVCYEAAPPDALDPCSCLRRAWSVAAIPASSTNGWKVQFVSLSACGRWVALVRANLIETCRDDVASLVDVFRVDGSNAEDATVPHAQLALRRGQAIVLSAWFRTQDLSQLDAHDGVARRRATIFCLCAHTFCDNGLAWHEQYTQWFPNAPRPGINRVYQYALEDGTFAHACARGVVAALPLGDGLLLRPQGVEVEMVPEHHTESVGLDTTSPLAPGAQFCRRDGMTMPVAQSFAPETCLVNPSNVHQCADSIGMCIRGAVTIPASEVGDEAGVQVCAVAQCVVLDLSYHNRNSGSDALLQPVIPMRSLACNCPPTPENVQLTRRGDLAVIMVRRAVPTGADAYFSLHIVGRRGASARFRPLACLDLDRCLYNFMTQRALASPLLPTTAAAVGAPPPAPPAPPAPVSYTHLTLPTKA